MPLKLLQRGTLLTMQGKRRQFSWMRTLHFDFCLHNPLHTTLFPSDEKCSEK